MLINMILSRIKVLFLSLIGLFRRAMCCFSRRRKSSSSEDLETVNVIIHSNDYSNKHNSQSDRDWNTWDDSPRTVEEHIEQYRQKLGRPPTPTEPEPEPDFFMDMTPKIKPQPVYYLGAAEEQNSKFSRLEAKLDVPIPVAADLEDWTEDNINDGGWEELDTETTKKLIREKRKELRNQRQNRQQPKDGFNRSQQMIFAERINNNVQNYS